MEACDSETGALSTSATSLENYEIQLVVERALLALADCHRHGSAGSTYARRDSLYHINDCFYTRDRDEGRDKRNGPHLRKERRAVNLAEVKPKPLVQKQLLAVIGTRCLDSTIGICQFASAG